MHTFEQPSRVTSARHKASSSSISYLVLLLVRQTFVWKDTTSKLTHTKLLAVHCDLVDMLIDVNVQEVGNIMVTIDQDNLVSCYSDDLYHVRGFQLEHCTSFSCQFLRT